MSSSEDPAAEAVMAAVEEADTLQSLLLQEIEEQDIKGLTQAIGEAQMRITELADSGDVEVARVYAMKLHQVIKDNAEDIKAFGIDDPTLNQIVMKIGSPPKPHRHHSRHQQPSRQLPRQLLQPNPLLPPKLLLHNPQLNPHAKPEKTKAAR